MGLLPRPHKRAYSAPADLSCIYGTYFIGDGGHWRGRRGTGGRENGRDLGKWSVRQGKKGRVSPPIGDSGSDRQ